MSCSVCGLDQSSCTCHHVSLLGFLSDFRSAAEPAKDVPISPSAAVQEATARARADSDAAPAFTEESGHRNVLQAPADGSPEQTYPYNPPQRSAPPPSNLAPQNSVPDLRIDQTFASAPRQAGGWRLYPPGQGKLTKQSPSQGRTWKVAVVAVAAALTAAGVVYIQSDGHPRGPSTSKVAAPASAPPIPAAEIPLSPAELQGRAVQDGEAQGWVHTEAIMTAPGHRAVYDDDAGPASGRQVITVDGAHAEVIVTPGATYMKGDAAAVTDFFGYPVSLGATLANRWISLVPADSDYSTVTKGVTISSDLTESILYAPLTLTGPTEINGVRVVGITGATSPTPSADAGTATLYVTAVAHPLPVEWAGSSPQGQETVKFSAWGTPQSLSAPSGALPASSIPSNAQLQ